MNSTEHPGVGEGGRPADRHCLWCAATAPPSAVPGSDWKCARCLRINPAGPGTGPEQTCTACGTVYPAKGHFCPSCAEESSVSPPSRWFTEHGLLPSPRAPIWPTKSWCEEDGEGLEPPPCKACGKPVRGADSAEHRHLGYAFPPWNAGWDGRCEACGQDFSVNIEQQTHFSTFRNVRIRPAESFHQTFVDEGVVFCGVRISVEETEYGYGKTPRVSEVFLTMGELAVLVRALQGRADVLMEQYDWTCDWT